MFWSTRKIIISTGHELHHPHYAHFYCYFSHRLGIERVKCRCVYFKFIRSCTKSSDPPQQKTLVVPVQDWYIV